MKRIGLQPKRRRCLVVLSAVLLAGTGFLASREAAFGYAGEKGSVAPDSTVMVSTHHTHLTRALAYCAGFDGDINLVNPVNPLPDPSTALAAERIALFDELTDQGTLTGDNGACSPNTWTNFNNTSSWSYKLPLAKAFGCDPAATTRVFPVTDSPYPNYLPDDQFFHPEDGWFTNRFGPWAIQFHFPSVDKDNIRDLDRMHDFLYSADPDALLSARSVYAWGAASATLWNGSCYDERREDIPTGDHVRPRSLEALGTYLHSIGDSYSHRVCHNNWSPDVNNPPWTYHTPLGTDAFVDGCSFNDHTWEFGCPKDTRQAAFIAGTVEGGVAVFNALVEYRQTMMPAVPPRVSSVDVYNGWLRRQIQRYAVLFGTNLNPAAGQCRVHYTHALMTACKVIAENPGKACYPDVIVSQAACPLAGRTSCNDNNRYYQLTPSCSGPAAHSNTAP